MSTIAVPDNHERLQEWKQVLDCDSMDEVISVLQRGFIKYLDSQVPRTELGNVEQEEQVIDELKGRLEHESMDRDPFTADHSFV